MPVDLGGDPARDALVETGCDPHRLPYLFGLAYLVSLVTFQVARALA
jgi:hypothetical protein